MTHWIWNNSVHTVVYLVVDKHTKHMPATLSQAKLTMYLTGI